MRLQGSQLLVDKRCRCSLNILCFALINCNNWSEWSAYNSEVDEVAVINGVISRSLPGPLPEGAVLRF